MKASFQKQEPKILHYRNYKFFDNGSFRNDLLYELRKMGFSNISCEQLEILFLTTLNEHVPPPTLKKRYVRANSSPFMTNTLYKAIMVRSRLRYKFLKSKPIACRAAYKKQRNFCVSPIRDTKKTIL